MPAAVPLFLSALAFAGLFLAWPGLDLAASTWLHVPGKGFVLARHPVFDLVHDYVGLLSWGLLLGALLLWLASWWRGLPDDWPRKLAGKRRAAVFIMLTQLLGPGLMVNTVLKDNWGRARPVHLVEFGGQAQFSPAWVPSEQCPKNCSFVCGDASVGFGLLALAFVARRPRPWLVLAVALGGALGLMRMAQGGHFLSDVVFSFYVVYFTAWLLHRWLFRGAAAGPASP